MKNIYNVWVGGVYDTFLNKIEAENKKDFWVNNGYKDVQIETITL